jgi:hypothetical protein
MVTFDLDVVTIEEEDSTDAMWDAQANRMTDYIRHTDSGSGRSQDQAWAPNVATPSETMDEDDGGEDVFTRGNAN